LARGWLRNAAARSCAAGVAVPRRPGHNHASRLHRRSASAPGRARTAGRVAAAGSAPQAFPVAGEDAMLPAIANNQLAYTRWKTDSNLLRIAGPVADEKERAKPPEKLIASTRDGALPRLPGDDATVLNKCDKVPDRSSI